MSLLRYVYEECLNYVVKSEKKYQECFSMDARLNLTDPFSSSLNLSREVTALPSMLRDIFGKHVSTNQVRGF